MRTRSSLSLRLAARALLNRDGADGAVLQRGQVREQVELLEHHADAAAYVRRGTGGVIELDAVHDDAAGVVRHQAVDAGDGGGFAGTGGAADHHALARRDGEIEARQHEQRPKALAHALHGDDRCHRTPRPSRRSRPRL
jgi:hypothetical protein